MKAGKTNIEVNAPVVIKGVKGEDAFLNGKTGRATHPFAFGCTGKDWVGIWLDAGSCDTPYGGQVNVKASEVAVID